MKATRDFAVLRRPAFRRYFVGRSVSELGTAMTQVALFFAVFAIGGDAGDVGLVLGVTVLPKVALVLLGGAAGDRLERRKVLLGTDVCMALCQAATALLLSGAGRLWHLALLQIVYGCAGAFALPATTGAVPDIAPKDLLQQANSMMRVPGTLSASSDRRAPECWSPWPGRALAVDAASFAAAAVAMAGLPAGLRTRQPHARLLRDVTEGWRTFISQPWIWMMVTSFAVYQATVLPAIYVAGPGIVESTVGVTRWAAVLTARAVGALVAGFPLLRWRPHRPLMLAAALLLLDVPFLVALWSGAGLAALLLGAAVARRAQRRGHPVGDGAPGTCPARGHRLGQLLRLAGLPGVRAARVRGRRRRGRRLRCPCHAAREHCHACGHPHGATVPQVGAANGAPRQRRRSAAGSRAGQVTPQSGGGKVHQHKGPRRG